MGITTEKYIRKPLYVDGVRVTAANFDELAAWCQGEVESEEVPGSGATKKFIRVRVHHPKNPKQTKAFVGDWILYTERGYKVYTHRAFLEAFDLVESVESDLDEELTEEEESEIRDEELQAEEESAIDESDPVTEFEETPIAPPPTPAIDPPVTDKRILTEEEQSQMGADEVRELVRSGEVVLAQDLAESA